MDNYDVGIGTEQIMLDVNVGTVGVTATVVTVNNEKIASSKDGNNIVNVNIGSADKLKNSDLIIQTMIDISHIENDLRTKAIENTVINYCLKGSSSELEDKIYDRNPSQLIWLSDCKVMILKVIKLI